MRAPPRLPPTPTVSSASLGRTGCLGALLGILLGVGGLIFAALWTAYVGPLKPLAAADPAQPDITITIQEAFLSHVVARSLPALPSGLASDVALDLQPANRIAFRASLRSTLLGQNLGGDATGVVILQANDGKLLMQFGELQVLGFSLPAIGKTLLNELAERMSAVIDERMRAGLGAGAYLMDLTTDDRQMIIRARWQP